MTADSVCELSGGHLVSVSSVAENEKLGDFYVDNLGAPPPVTEAVSRVWLGGSDRESEVRRA